MKLPFERGRRRRIYLMRHAEAAYGARGAPADPRLVPLTERGREEAASMRKLLADTPLDRAVCSGLPRTHETARIVLDSRDLPLEVVPELEEVRLAGASTAGPRGPDIARELAYALWSAKDPEGAFLGGERFSELWRRVTKAVEALLAQPHWTRMLLVGHGAVNRVVLAWALGGGQGTIPHMEQESCCLNVIDVDIDDETGTVLRHLVRLLNLTPHDLLAGNELLTWLERQAQRVSERLG